MPAMEAALKAERDDKRLTGEALRLALGFVPDQVFFNTLRDLKDEDFIDWRGAHEGGQLHPDIDEIWLRPNGRRFLRDWPTGDSVEALVRAIERQIEETDDPQEKSKLRKVLDQIGGVSKSVVTSVVTQVVKEVTGLG